MKHNLALSVYHDASTYNQRLFVAWQHRNRPTSRLRLMRQFVYVEANKQLRNFQVHSSSDEISIATDELDKAMSSHAQEFHDMDPVAFFAAVNDGWRGWLV